MTYCKIFCFSIVIVLFSSCSKVYETPDGCVVNFVLAIERHDVNIAWSMLSPEAQKFYNSLGEKNRKSGKGILESEIKNIKYFKNISKDYSIKKDRGNPDVIRLVLSGSGDYLITTVKVDEGFKIKDGNSVRNVLHGIAAEYENKNLY